MGQGELIIIDLIEERDINDYVKLISLGRASPYCHIEYIRQHQNDSTKAICFVFKKDEECLGLMPMLVRSIPGTDHRDAISLYGYSGPTFQDGIDMEDRQLFWEMVDRWYGDNQIVTEFIRFSLDNNHLGYSGRLDATLKNVCGPLKGHFDSQWQSFDKKVRNNYRKAQSFGLSFKLHDAHTITGETIDAFYEIYHKTMVRNKASSFLFFSNDFFQELLSVHKGDYAIAMATHENQPISTELLVQYRNNIYAFLGGTDSAYFHMRPNDYLRVEIIKRAIETKRSHYILGGGMKEGDNLYRSKKVFFPYDGDRIFYTGRKIINMEIHDSLVQQAKEEWGGDLDKTYFPLYRAPNTRLVDQAVG